MKKLRAIDLTYGAVFVCLMSIGANITVWFPFLAVPIGGASVPLSLQTFFSILAGLMLGRKLGTIAIITYIFIGFAGVPVFAGLSGGPMAFVSPTGGFILSFIFIAYVTGWMSDNMKKESFTRYLGAAVIGLILNYGIGVSYMYAAMNLWLEIPITYGLAWASMIPFLVKDAAMAGLAAMFMASAAKRISASLSRV
jgi:biotin transport system substrate-specific component